VTEEGGGWQRESRILRGGGEGEGVGAYILSRIEVQVVALRFT
jgi:hypothetical protein